MSFVIFWLSAAALGLMSWLFWWNQRVAFRLSATCPPLATPMVSVCIPARDEAANLPITLPLCLQSTYPSLEILVLDDQSTDQTAAIVTSLADAHPGRVRLLTGAPLPEGANGKNWACQQLAAAAKGDILLFCDADVSIGPNTIAHTVSWLQRTGAGVLTAIPHQRLVTWAEMAVVPLVMHVVALGFLSLRRAFMSPAPALTTANGQWLAWTRACYEEIGGHAAVQDAIVEDMVLCKRAKAHGFRVCPVLAFDGISVRMYRSFRGVWEGYAKNLYGLLNYNPGIVLAALLVYVAALVLPWLLAFVIGGVWWWLALGLLGARLYLALMARHSLWSVVLHPVGALLLIAILVDSIRRYYQGSLTWKERTLSRPGQPAGGSVPAE